MKRLVGLALVVSAVSTPLAAQNAPDLEVSSEPSAVACLETGDRTLRYPSGVNESRAGGVFRVRMTFSAPDRAPEVAFEYVSAGSEFEDEVKRVVAGYRMPCLRAGDSPRVVTQEFEFVAGLHRDVRWQPAQAVPKPGPVVKARCLRGAEELPHFPAAEGNVLARLKFTAANSEPDVTIVYSAGPRVERAVRRAVSRYRLDCLQPEDFPITIQQSFSFRFAGEEPLLKDLPLRVVLGSMKDRDRQRVRFDLSTMKCPFELRFELRQPYMKNAVGEVGPAVPERRALIEWLSTVDFELTSDQRRAMVGEMTSVSIPCGVVDLT